MSAKRLFVPMGQCVTGKKPCKLYCTGLGSCVAICFYNAKKKSGSLAHILLPYGEDGDKPFFFANLAVRSMIDAFNKSDGLKCRILAKIAGGANIFPNMGGENPIGSKNVESVKYWLDYYKIPVIGEDVGGIEGRNVTFDLMDGKLEIFTLKRGRFTI